ncbi:MAG: PilT protein domain protein [Microgenomates group bacterium Gr01-1014_16]|nr:MAG: PilT protein domain protein [Microgenomates group bacterium Gr01-1014_16]
MIVDSTVFIQFFRDNPEARKFFLDTDEQLETSRIVVMEVMAGTKSGALAKKAEKQILELGVKIVELDEDISARGGILFRDYYHTNGIGIMDAFVAATALVHGQKLATHNVKHFKFIKGLDLIVPY